MKRERTVAELKAEKRLSKRYRKIGIPALAAALRYHSARNEEPEFNSKKRDGALFRGTSPRR